MSNLLALGHKPTHSLPNLADDLNARLGDTSDHVHPDQLKPDLQAWHQLRIKAFGIGNFTTALPGPDAVATLTLYYAQLTHVKTRIPPRLNLTFPWYPATPPAVPSGPGLAATPSTPAPPRPCSLTEERLYTLYTLAYVHAFIGATTRRADEAGIRAALAAFQTAAGVLEILARELDRAAMAKGRGAASSSSSSKSEEEKGSMTTDLNEKVVGTLRTLCLAQAQEVAWQKAVMDRLKNGTVAKVAMHAAELYQQALVQAEAVRSSGTVEQFAFADNLMRFLAFKHAHFTAVAHYRRSLDDLGANRYGDELGRLRICERALADVLLPSKPGGGGGKRGVPEAVVRDLKSMHSMISENLARATKDNDLIYLASPTPPSSLPPIVPFPLAKPTPPRELLEPLNHLSSQQGGAWLQAMLPSRVRDALEVWDDRKRVWFADEVQKVVRGLDDQATSSLATMNLPAALESTRHQQQQQQQPAAAGSVVPPHLLEHSQRIQGQGGLAKLETMMKDVRRISSVNRKLVQESRDLLDREAEIDSSYRQMYGPSRWSRPTSAEAAAPLFQRVEQFEAVLAAASQSDGLVRAKYGEWESALALLERGQSALREAIPSPASSSGGGSNRSSSSAVESQKTARQLRAALEDLSTLRADRDRLVHAAQTRMEQASIRSRLEKELMVVLPPDDNDDDKHGTAASAQVEQIHEDELEKLSAPWEEELRTSKARQEDLLDQIARLNGAFTASRRTEGDGGRSSPERDAAIQKFELAAAKFDEMQQNLHEGLKFYADLSRLLGELRDAVKDFVSAREADAHERLLQASAAESASPAAVAADSAPSPHPAGARSTPSSSSSVATPARRTAAAGRRETRQSRPVEHDDDGSLAVPEPAAAASGWDPSQGIRFG
ncbi:hypothetical protein B0A53_03193 [Rhodotorula sp. CCFEE 5036]|nr:hypothetical protein B0A53_03193 [Rhodotorula sp. CCFEE 5036]